MARIQIPDTFFWFLAVCIYFAFYLHFISETVRTRLEKCTRLNHWLREVIHSLATIIVYEMECTTQWSQAKAIDSGPEQTTECWDLSWTLNASKESQSCLSVTKGTLLSIFQDDSWSWSPLGCHHLCMAASSHQWRIMCNKWLHSEWINSFLSHLVYSFSALVNLSERPLKSGQMPCSLHSLAPELSAIYSL